MEEQDVQGLSPLLEAAVHAHELFLSFMQAGFTEEQAIKLVIGLLSNRAE